MVRSPKRSSLLFVVALLIARCIGATCPTVGLNSDCNNDFSDASVNMKDLAVFATYLQQAGSALVINEVLASNSTTIRDAQQEYDDYIEIYNTGDQPIDMGGMYLTDDLSEPTKWQIPDDRPSLTKIPGHGYLLIWADNDTGQTDNLHANFKLDADGEEVGLFARDHMQIDSILFGKQTTDISFGRYPDGGPDLRFFGSPTPCEVNNNAYLGVVDDLQCSHQRGFYENAISVTVATVTDGAAIYYTTDGSEPIKGQSPSAASTEYNGAIYISSNTSLRAAAIKDGWMPSRTITHTYVFNANGVGGYDASDMKSMPVYSIVGDPDTAFWGPDGIMRQPQFQYRGIAYERPVSFEIIDAQTGLNCQVDCGTRIAGSDYHRVRYTVGDNWHGSAYNGNKISLKLYFRGRYGDNELDYPAFPMADTDKFQSLQLRGGFNDMHDPFIKDEWYRRLNKDMGGVASTGTIVNFFLNGKFKSYFNPCQRYDEDFFRDYFDVDTDWDVITHRGVRDGDTVAWDAAMSFFSNNDMSNSANYAQAGEIIDIINLIDYLIIEQYSGNTDWAHPNYTNNWTASRERTPEGKWRFHCWDMELPTVPSASSGIPSVSARSESFRLMFRKLTNNPEFRLLFADRLQKHFFYDGALTQTNLTKRFTELEQQMSQVLSVDSWILNNFIPGRQQTLLSYYTSQGLFPGQGPDFQVNGVSQHGGYVSSTDTITITRTGGSESIYYTTDGNDPRTPALSILLSEGAVLVDEDAPKALWIPMDDMGTGWRGADASYDDSGWISGSGAVGYERSFGYENIIGFYIEEFIYNTNSTCYIRIPFFIDRDELLNADTLILRVRYDDGFVAYINGTEVQRANLDGEPQWNSAANTEYESSDVIAYDISSYISALQTGDNILAIQGLNTNATDSDFLISAALEIPDKIVEINSTISPSATEYTDGFTLSKSTHLKSRIFNSDTHQWSPLNEAVFTVGPVRENLRITEIMYHPEDTGDPNDPNTEYIELMNIGTETINLNLVQFTDGIDFTFGDTELTPGECVLVVKDRAAFSGQYPMFSGHIAGQYTGSLNNAGENITLEDAIDRTIVRFKYEDDWYDLTDGDGSSLTVNNPTHTDPNDYGNKDMWQAASPTPGEVKL